jgi:hypothetical protein
MYLSEKFTIDEFKNNPLDFYKLRELLVHGRNKAKYKKYKYYYHNILDKIIWIIIPELSYFKNLRNLSNFLGNFLNVNIKEDEYIKNMIIEHKLKTKEDVIDAYRNLYICFNEEKKLEVLRELGRGIFVVSTKEELKKFQMKYSLLT